MKNKQVSENVNRASQEIGQMLSDVKICDPAIGSGAFPMGLLQEIYQCKLALREVTPSPYFKERGQGGEVHARIKLDIIQNSIYGVDIERGAVDIARLRFWLSLVVDEDRPRPLPNLDYKIVVGNSLVSKIDDEILTLDWTLRGFASAEYEIVRLTKLLSQKQRAFFTASGDKATLQREILDLKIDLLTEQIGLDRAKVVANMPGAGLFQLSGKEQKKRIEGEEQLRSIDATLRKLKALRQDPTKLLPYFDWRLDFPEVLNPHVTANVGFDIVIGNPPYDVFKEKEKIAQAEEIFKNSFFEIARGGNINVYRLFLAQSVLIAKQRGLICQIFQNSFLADNSAKFLRKYFLENQSIIRIDSYPERDNVQKRVFESAKMSVCILLSQNVKQPDYAFNLFIWQDRLQTAGKSVIYNSTEISKLDPTNYCILSMAGAEKELVVKMSKFDRMSAYGKCWTGEIDLTLQKGFLRSPSTLFVKMIKGAAVQKWMVKDTMSQGEVQYLDAEQYLAKNRGKKASHYRFERIVMQGITGVDEKSRLKMAVLEPNIFCGNSVNYFLLNSNSQHISTKFLLATLNSKLLNWYFKLFSTNSNVNGYEVDNLPLALPVSDNYGVYVEIVTQILNAKRANPTADTSALEAEIDLRVYHLYGLTHAEVLLVDPAFGMSEAGYEAAGRA